MKLITSVFFAPAFFVTSLVAAQTAPAVQITGDSLQPFTLTATLFAAMPHTTLDAKGHDEKIHRYEGVLLSDILAKAGVHLGTPGRKTTAATYVTLKAADNYTCVCALAELDTLFTDKKILLADKQDGGALPAATGAFQVIATGEKLHARWIRQVIAIEVKTVR